jgi:type IV pilus assembly protein PilY1
MKRPITMKKLPSAKTRLALAIAACLPFSAHAQLVVSDTLTGATSTYGWTALNGACLTAGVKGSTATTTIPACNGLTYYGSQTQVGGTSGTLPDAVGSGALRLTNGSTYTQQKGSVVSSTPFPTTQGVQVTFSTVTYGGNGYSNGTAASGADGIAFMLLDGTQTSPALGSTGGSLGYSCSNANSPYDGVTKGYLAVAIDEFGNFSSKSDNTASGTTSSAPGTIAVRGAGNVNWAALNAAYPAYYPSTLSTSDQRTAVLNTCKTGYLQNWGSLTTTTTTTKNGKTTTTTTTTTGNHGSTTTAVLDYPILLSATKVNGTIYNQENYGTKSLRGNANVLTYSLKITADNLLSLSYNVNGGATTPVITSQDITSGNGSLPSSFLFGFTAGTGSGTNVHEITCFKAAAISTAANSATTNVQQSTKVIEGTQVYLSYYHPLNSWGQLLATPLTADTSDIVTVSGTANWDAGCVLTGGSCTATGGTNTAQASTSRKIITWNPTTSAGIPFQYTSLSTAQQTAMGGSTDGLTRLSYLRGDRSNELTTTNTTGPFRKRDSVLGDIRSSSPTLVGVPSSSYSTSGKDLLTKTTVAEFGTLYSTFISNNATRLNVVYNGANDGMLHGFRAGAYTSSGTYNATSNDGQEVIAYVPSAAVSSIHSSTSTSLDYSSPQYAHNYFVDATPGTGDLYYNGAWHTWLVGGMGAGGNTGGATNDTVTTTSSTTTTTSVSTDNGVLFALDITDPTTFTEANAAALVKGEWSSSTLTCTTDTSSSTCKSNLGAQYGTPIIRLLHDGNWAVIFGNGRNSVNGAAGIFVMTVNRTSGAVTTRYIDTATSSTTNKNGIDFVTSADLDSDHVTDYVYAGDKLGNLWRFDLTSATPSSWAATKMFTTPSAQPISTRITVSSVAQTSGSPRVVLNFGTGRATPQTLTAAAAYATGTHYMYGIWDWNMAAWNAASTTQYASLAAPQTFTSTDLQTQTMTTVTNGTGAYASYRTMTQNAVCWKGSTNCSSGNTQFGWQVQLTGTNEQIIYNPVVSSGVLYFNTYIPGVDQALSCTSTAASGYTMGISPETGAGVSAFADATTAAGVGVSATGTPSVVTSGANTFLVQQTVSGTAVVVKVNATGTAKGTRVTWTKLR